jgi:hypothetical protein
MKKIIAFFTVVALSTALIVGAGANDKILKAHKAQGDKGKVNGKEMTCASCHNATANGIAKKKGQGLKKGEANYAKVQANNFCKPCHK